MEKAGYTAADVATLFGMQARTTLLKAEADGRIPVADRVKRGIHNVRLWRVDQLPAIGSQYGFLSPPKSMRTICVFTSKGGVLKSTLSYTLGRMLALNGIKTLIVGLDIQGTVTDFALHPVAIETLADAREHRGLADMYAGKATLDEIIAETDLPTLNIIPETPALTQLEQRLRDRPRREYWLRTTVVDPLRDRYQVLIFDNSPHWHLLVENSLTAADVVVSPIGCELGSYQSLDVNLAATLNFKDEMQLAWDALILVPTLYERTKLSTQILSAYLTRHPELVVPTSIRKAVRGQEALVYRQTPLEADPHSELADDYRELIGDLWRRVLEAESKPAAAKRKRRTKASH